MPPSQNLARASAPDRFRPGWVAVIAVAWMVAYAVWSAVAPPFETPLESLIDEAAIVPLRLGIAALGLWLGTRENLPRRARVAFLGLGVSFGLGALSNVLRLIPVIGTPLDPPLALAITVLQAMLLLGGLALLTRLGEERARAADWLDGAAIVLAVYLLAAHFITGGNPFVSSHLGARRWQFLIYLGGDVIAVLLLATTWFRRPAGLVRDSVGFLILGFALVGVADLVFDQQLQQGTLRNGGLLDATVALGFLLILLGLDLQRRRAGVAEPPAVERPERTVIASAAILSSTIPMLVLSFTGEAHPSHLAFHVAGVVLLLVLVLLRHYLDRERLTEMVRERSAADARFRSLVQRSSDAILQISTDHVIQWASPSASELAGTIPSLLAGRRITDLAHPEDRDRVAVFLANAGQPFTRNAALRWRMGRPDAWHEVESVVTDLTGDPTVRSYVLNTRNVSERVRLEQQLRQAQKLEAVGRLSGGIAHDFNNILAAILSHAQLVRQGLPSGDQRSADLLEIEQTAQRGAALTRRLLSFSRPEAGELQIQSLPVVIRGMEALLRRLLVDKVELQLDLGDAELWVRAVEGQVEQILMNLAINARDAMPGGGTVVVRTRALSVRPGQATIPGVLPGRWAELLVKDTGIGMSPDTLSRLFEPFFTTKPSGLGTGLGLTTVRGIVRSLGGHVHAESAPGQGTTMHVLLPLSQPGEAPVPAPRASPAMPIPARSVVMVVDDESALRSAMVRFLERSGFAPVGAGSAIEAMELLAARKYEVDLVITDMVMPGMGGREFVRHLREQRPSLPVLCISGHIAWESDDDDAPDAPWRPERLLAKPFAFPDFLHRVREALSASAAP